MRYAAGWNVPGCLPDYDGPHIFDDKGTAGDFIVDELLAMQSAYWHDDRPRAMQYRKALNEFTQGADIVEADGYVYWVEPYDGKEG